MSDVYSGELEVTDGLGQLKVGDAVLNLVPKGDQALKLRQYGLSAIYGCVDLVSPPEIVVPRVTLWGTMFAFMQRIYTSDEDRTFSPETVAVIETEPAEIHIPRASGGKFEYGQLTDMIHPGGSTRVVVDSYHDGLVSGLREDGERCSGGAVFFSPVDLAK